MTPNPIRYDHVPSPLGPLLVATDDAGLCQLAFADRAPAPAPSWRRDPPALAPAAAQLGAYFAGEQLCFELPLAPRGTEFQQRVWRQLLAIEPGTTASYQSIARAIGAPRAVRAVGAANGANPLALVIPCHRVIGSRGDLVGYAGGLERKRWLLDHERRASR